LGDAEEIVAVEGGICSSACECFCGWISTAESGAGVRPSDGNIVKCKIRKLFDIPTVIIKFQSLCRPCGSNSNLLLVIHAFSEGRQNIVVNKQGIYYISGESNAEVAITAFRQEIPTSGQVEGERVWESSHKARYVL
jgi:hypothetical protein